MTTATLPAHLAEEFRTWLTRVGAANSRTPGDLYALWLQYARDCQAYDQSPVMSEFLDWHSLKPPAEEEQRREIAWAAATDVGNRSARAGGRERWSEDDYNAAVDEFNRLWTEEEI